LPYVCRKPCEPAEREVEAGLVTAIYAGTGFLMVTRTAIARMIDAYRRPLPGHPRLAAADGPERERYALFDTMIHPETGEYLSEDYAFCHRWRAIGGRIWLDTQCRLTHVGSFEFHGNLPPASPHRR